MRQALAFFASIAMLATALPGAAQDDAAHRAAIQRYLEASRTVAFLRHYALPIEIREAAVAGWGFDGMRLGVDEILAMEAQVDVAALERRLTEIHARHITAADADEVTRFYLSPPMRRYFAASMGKGFLPSSDPLLRDGVPEPRKDDEEAMRAFVATPLGARLKAAEKQVVAETFALLRELADAAVGRYVAANSLPNRKRS